MQNKKRLLILATQLLVGVKDRITRKELLVIAKSFLLFAIFGAALSIKSGDPEGSLRTSNGVVAQRYSFPRGIIQVPIEPIYYTIDRVSLVLRQVYERLEIMSDNDFIKNFDNEPIALRHSFTLGQNMGIVAQFVIAALFLSDQLMKYELTYADSTLGVAILAAIIRINLDIGKFIGNPMEMVKSMLYDPLGFQMIAKRLKRVGNGFAYGTLWLPQLLLLAPKETFENITSFLKKVIAEGNEESFLNQAKFLLGYSVAQAFLLIGLINLSTDVSVARLVDCELSKVDRFAYLLRLYPIVMVALRVKHFFYNISDYLFAREAV